MHINRVTLEGWLSLSFPKPLGGLDIHHCRPRGHGCRKQGISDCSAHLRILHTV